MTIVQDAVLDLAGTPWVLLAVAVLSFVDGFFPPLPSESIIIAVAALGAGEANYGPLSFTLLILCAAVGAFFGDHLAYEIGRRLPLDRVPFLRGEGGAKALTTASRALERRGTVLIVSARFVPIGRIAVNMTAGATGFPRLRFAVVDAAAVLLWAGYSAALGAGVGAALNERPLLAVVVGVAGGVLLGVILDKVIAVVHRRWFPQLTEPEHLDLSFDEEGHWRREDPEAQQRRAAARPHRRATGEETAGSHAAESEDGADER